MAKLKAHGAQQARATLERETPNGELTSWERLERTFMADGKAMEKRTVRFRPSASWDPPQGRVHTWGWKLRGTIKPGITVEQWATHYRQKGWTVEVYVHSLPVTLPVAQTA
jgi:hypothetical protein